MIAPLLQPSLDTVLSEAVGANADPDRALLALAKLSPSRCVSYLASEDAGRRLHSLDAVAKALALALDGPLVPASAVAAALARFPEVLTPALAVRTVSSFGTPVPDGVADAVGRCLARHPNAPDAIRAMLAIVQQRNDRGRTDELLTRLGVAENTLATVSSVYRARKALDPVERSDARVALLSSFTIDQLVPFIDLECHTAGLAAQTYVAPFNSWARDVIDPASSLRHFDPDIAFLSIAIDDLIPQLCGAAATRELADAGSAAVDQVLTVAEGFARSFERATLVVHGFHSAFDTGPLGVLEGRAASSRREWLGELNARLAAGLRALPRCFFLDVEAVALAAGRSLTDNPKIRHMASMRLAPTALGAVARAYVKYIVPLKGLPKKCVVLDLDNTLWGGLAGEDGARGIRLAKTSPGSEFVEFQAYLAGLRARGILLAVNSKNNPDDALEIIRSHEAMVLGEDAFSAIRINWQPKHENMISIAQQLNVGLDSLVFVDDNPSERDQMRQMLPQVLTVDLPRDPALYRCALEALPQLEVLSLTVEDQARAGMYQTAQLRERSRGEAASLDDYLRSLEIKVAIAPAPSATFGRVAQLFTRTNQFNATTRRYDASAVERFANDPSKRLVALNSQDRFGEHGLVAVALIRTAGRAWEIDSFLMSCRVIGYGIETALLASLALQAKSEGATWLVGEFIASSKNAPAKDLFARHGFTMASTLDGLELWRLNLSNPIPFPSWIERV